MSQAQKKAVLRTLKLEDTDSSSDDDQSTDNSDSEFDDSQELSQPFQVPASQKLQTILIESHYTWFQVMDALLDGIELEDDSEKCFAAVRELGLARKEEELHHSYEAYTQDLLTK